MSERASSSSSRVGFGSLYYTDCRPGQGLSGGAGFQFQAATPGPATEAMPLVARAGLYEPPAAWMREQRPVPDYPLSLAHVVDGDLLATAAGRYLGTEANGNREGNQFTHAVVTRDGADYGLVRPAQLWAAAWWSAGPATGTDLAPLPASPATGPLDTETVRERVRAAPDAERLLLTLLSALHGLGGLGGPRASARRPVVLVTAEPERAACWIAAATMLLPSADALRTTFKIFVADPQQSGHDVIAVHPEWAGRWADTGPDTGLAVLDLDRGRCTAVEPTEEALFWVPRFLRDDAYDVVDAVELAGQFAGRESRATGADRTVAMVLAAGAPLGSAAEVAAAAGWMRTAPEQAVALARDPVIDAVLAARPGAPVLRALAGTAGARGWYLGVGGPAGRINRGVLAAELVEVLEAPSGAAALRDLQDHPELPPDPSADADRDPFADVLPAAAPDRVPALLWLARRHRLERRGEAWTDAVARFVPWWVTCDEPALDAPRWAPLSTELLPAVRAELSRMLDGDSSGEAEPARRAVRRHWWAPLWPTAHRPADPLDGLLISTAYPHLDRPRQDTLLRTVLRALGDAPPRGAHPTSLAWALLFAESRPCVAEAERFVGELRALGMDTAPDVAAALCAVLDAEPGVSATALAVAEKIRADGQPLSPRQARRLAERDGLRGLAADLAAERPVAELARRLDGTEAGVLAATAPDVVDALLAASAGRAVPVLCGCRRATLTPLYLELERRWPRPAAVVTDAQARAAALTFELVHAGPGDRDQRDDFAVLRTRLARVVLALPAPDRARIARAVRFGDRWEQWVAGLEPKRWSLSRLARPGRAAGRDG